jgi:hypothetical protein
VEIDRQGESIVARKTVYWQLPIFFSDTLRHKQFCSPAKDQKQMLFLRLRYFVRELFSPTCLRHLETAIYPRMSRRASCSSPRQIEESQEEDGADFSISSLRSLTRYRSFLPFAGRAFCEKFIFVPKNRVDIDCVGAGERRGTCNLIKKTFLFADGSFIRSHL